MDERNCVLALREALGVLSQTEKWPRFECIDCKQPCRVSAQNEAVLLPCFHCIHTVCAIGRPSDMGSGCICGKSIANTLDYLRCTFQNTAALNPYVWYCLFITIYNFDPRCGRNSLLQANCLPRDSLPEQFPFRKELVEAASEQNIMDIIFQKDFRTCVMQAQPQSCSLRRLDELLSALAQAPLEPVAVKRPAEPAITTMLGMNIVRTDDEPPIKRSGDIRSMLGMPVLGTAGIPKPAFSRPGGTIPAKFPSKIPCVLCNQQYAVGVMITKHGNGWVHKTCFDTKLKNADE